MSDADERASRDADAPADASADPDVTARIHDLAREARTARETVEPPASPPDEERATAALREGFGPVVWVYVEGRTGGRTVPFDETDMSLLRAAMNDWLSVYATCHGRSFDPEFTVREAAKLLIETRNVRDTAQVLTRIPER